jgi:hypothetical protein
VNQEKNTPYQSPQSDVENTLAGFDIVRYRKKLVPIWIKIFGWLFIVFSIAVPVLAVYSALTGIEAQYSLYGLSETGTIASPIVLFTMVLFIAHGVCAYGLLFGESWGLRSCILLGYLSVMICFGTMFMSVLERGAMTLRLELIVFIPYLIQLRKLRSVWDGEQRA